MHVDAIRLVNFKAFRELDLEMRGLTLLSGLNGSGKSSVVQALGLLRQSHDGGALGGGELLLNGPFVEIGTGKDLLHQYFDEQEVVIELGLSSGERLSWSAAVSPDADVLTCRDAQRNDEIAELNLFKPGFNLLRADRIVPSVTFPRSRHAIANARTLGPRGEYTAHFLLAFGDELRVSEQLRHPSETGPTLNSQVNAWLREFSPGVRVKSANVAMTDMTRLEYSFQEGKSSFGEALRPTNVGFGLTHALPVVTACLAAQAGDLVVIENPEAQLHPRGQAALGRLLALAAGNGAQVTVETHSDHVLNGIRLAVKQGRLNTSDVRLHFFSRHPGGSAYHVTPEIDGDGRLSFWPEGFFDQWERSLDALLA